MLQVYEKDEITNIDLVEEFLNTGSKEVLVEILKYPSNKVISNVYYSIHEDLTKEEFIDSFKQLTDLKDKDIISIYNRDLCEEDKINSINNIEYDILLDILGK